MSEVTGHARDGHQYQLINRAHAMFGSVFRIFQFHGDDQLSPKSAHFQLRKLDVDPGTICVFDIDLGSKSRAWWFEKLGKCGFEVSPIHTQRYVDGAIG